MLPTVVGQMIATRGRDRPPLGGARSGLGEAAPPPSTLMMSGHGLRAVLIRDCCRRPLGGRKRTIRRRGQSARRGGQLRAGIVSQMGCRPPCSGLWPGCTSSPPGGCCWTAPPCVRAQRTAIDCVQVLQRANLVRRRQRVQRRFDEPDRASCGRRRQHAVRIGRPQRSSARAQPAGSFGRIRAERAKSAEVRCPYSRSYCLGRESRVRRCPRTDMETALVAMAM